MNTYFFIASKHRFVAFLIFVDTAKKSCVSLVVNTILSSFECDMTPMGGG